MLTNKKSFFNMLLERRQRRRREKRRWYVRPLNVSKEAKGEFHSLVNDTRMLQDDEFYFRYFRMSPARFDDLLRRISPFITHQGTHHTPVSPAERLSLERYAFVHWSLMYFYRSLISRHELSENSTCIASQDCSAIVPVFRQTAVI